MTFLLEHWDVLALLYGWVCWKCYDEDWPWFAAPFWPLALVVGGFFLAAQWLYDWVTTLLEKE